MLIGYHPTTIRCVRAVVSALVWIPLICFAARVAPAAEKPNVVLIMADDQSWGDERF